MKIYHLCLSSHDEVMYRTEADYIYGFNCFGVACLETESDALCDSILSTHSHLGARSSDPKYLMFRSRNSYSRYFNCKYRRRGKLGEKNYYLTEINGAKHQIAAFSYILRQGLHHGICDTPFGYRYCSINSYFRKDMGKDSQPSLIADCHRSRSLPHNIKVPAKYRMDKSGLLLREDILDISYIENLYVSPRNFLYHMNRKSGEEWIKEQIEEDPLSEAITLAGIEKGIDDYSLQKMLQNENGRRNPYIMTDLELCHIIDTDYVHRYSKIPEATIYDLSPSQRVNLGNKLYSDLKTKQMTRKSGEIAKTASIDQIRRCAVIRPV